METKVRIKKYPGKIATYRHSGAQWVHRRYMKMKPVDIKAESNETELSKGNLKKYTYLLPSGRKLKVILDDSGDYSETACSSPCFLLRIDDEAVG